MANTEFEEQQGRAHSVADADRRRDVMRRLLEIMLEEGHIMQPGWRFALRHHIEGLVNVEEHPAFEISSQGIGWAG